jgi:AraC-like DNA-binding protein
MPKITPLDKQWAELMRLCEHENAYRRDRAHSKLQRLVAERIESLAKELGFSPTQTARREFRAERQGEHIVRIETEKP